MKVSRENLDKAAYSVVAIFTCDGEIEAFLYKHKTLFFNTRGDIKYTGKEIAKRYSDCKMKVYPFF